ncbi:hypothetical protein PBI_TEAMOCIL_22 [Microbacterium phage Teamocil]|uniref:Uncharacterized protein n=1 Tax=Microbacterium phage Teamocil TaxID=2656554 RepID=A0A649VWW5_9CAUD|nr:hypothetical protein QDA12_gp22 [Microbacterium phage Teamocil]QGJ88948.1 hypothetical protein PBI_GINA_22 [Microbacterium phage Gina]QGJ97047.1 hypothetical protein PBI_TEAMOCIL_22 [Microbacterium phage Teamocil]
MCTPTPEHWFRPDELADLIEARHLDDEETSDG